MFSRDFVPFRQTPPSVDLHQSIHDGASRLSSNSAVIKPARGDADRALSLSLCPTPSIRPSVCLAANLALSLPDRPSERRARRRYPPLLCSATPLSLMIVGGCLSPPSFLVDEGRIGRELFLSLRARAEAIITRREFRHRQRLLTSSRRRWPRTRWTWREIEKPGAHSRSFTWRRRRQKKGAAGRRRSRNRQAGILISVGAADVPFLLDFGGEQ